MNSLDYEILFIEDDFTFVKSVKLPMEKFLNEQGFKLKITQKKGDDLDVKKINPKHETLYYLITNRSVALITSDCPPIDP